MVALAAAVVVAVAAATAVANSQRLSISNVPLVNTEPPPLNLKPNTLSKPCTQHPKVVW